MEDLLSVIRTTDRKWRIGLINGPNMPNLANRPRTSKGTPLSIAALERRIERLARALGVEVTKSVCSNHEGVILDWLHSETADLDGILINPAGLTFTGHATRMALQETGLPAIEVHYQNSGKWGGLESIFTKSVVGTCQGMRKHSYAAALVAMVAMLDDGDFAPSVGMLDSPRADRTDR
jgi:3-dehydroquinate dehydratase-2